jgi:hypothetical protein
VIIVVVVDILQVVFSITQLVINIIKDMTQSFVRFLVVLMYVLVRILVVAVVVVVHYLQDYVRVGQQILAQFAFGVVSVQQNFWVVPSFQAQ